MAKIGVGAGGVTLAEGLFNQGAAPAEPQASSAVSISAASVQLHCPRVIENLMKFLHGYHRITTDR